MKNILTALLYLSLTACASTYRPVVDTKVSPPHYEQDLADCKNYAGSDSRAGVGAVIGGVFGATFGILALAGTDKANAARNIGMAVGAISGAFGAMKEQREVVARCMAGRGYSVLQ